MQLPEQLLEMIVCPACRGQLAADEDTEELVCTGCRRAYPVRDDIPLLLLDEARQRD